MRDAEADIAEAFSNDGWLTVLDGPLHGIRHRRGLPVIGYVKTHHRRMFAREHWVYDTRLSGNGTQSCATCHIQALAFTETDLQKPKPAVLWTTTPARKSWPTSNCTMPTTGRLTNTPTPTPFSNSSRTDPAFQTAAVS